MAGTKLGAQRAKARQIEKYGSVKAYKKAMAEKGGIGGSRSNNGGFASDIVGKDGLTGKQRSRIAGRLGGKISRRRPAKK